MSVGDGAVHKAAPPERALLVRLSSIGDVVHTLPAYMALRRSWPSTLLGWAVEPAAAALVQRLPGPLTVHVLDIPRWRRRPLRANTMAEVKASVAALRGAGYELALDFQGLVKSAIVARLTGAPAMGFHRENLREPLAARLYASSAPAVATSEHVIRRGLALAAAAGAQAETVEFPELTDDADLAYVERQLAALRLRRFAVMHATANWSSKAWPEHRWVETARALSHRSGLPVLWIWGPRERHKTLAMAHGAGLDSRLSFPTTLTQLAALLRRADLFIGGDSAPLHLAVAAGTPVIGLFGPTDPGRNGPLAKEDVAIVRHLPCSFCYRRRCPIGTRQCMEELAPEAVVEAACRRLETGLARTE